MRILGIALCLLAACSSTKKEGPSAAQLEEENRKLVAFHTDIWKLMGLSQAAQDELNKFVLGVNKNLQHNRHHDSEKFNAIREKRDPNWQKQTREEYVRKHRERFTKLGISEATQQELFSAMEFVWKALHAPNVPEKDREVAKKIQEMMKQLPKCCDDSIFERAAAH